MPSARFDPDSYEDVASRIGKFREEFADGAISTEVHNDGLVYVRAMIECGDRRATGHAAVLQLGEPKALEKAETSAIGRALVAFGYSAKKASAKTSAGVRPSVPVDAPGGRPAEPSPRNPWNQWIEETFPNLSITEHRRLVKAALESYRDMDGSRFEKLPKFHSDAGLRFRESMT